MALSFAEKEAIVSEVAEVAASAYSAVTAEYIGLSAEEMTELRAKARSGGVYLRVVKNTLARRAVNGTDYECLQDTLTGPLLLAFSQEDPGAAARVLKDFAKDSFWLLPKLTVWPVCRLKSKPSACSCLSCRHRLPNLPVPSTKFLASWFVLLQRFAMPNRPLNELNLYI
jgi:ribosomal protein L10